MPIPDKYKKDYGKIIGHLINIGFSPRIAKQKTEKAIKDKTKADRKKKGKRNS